MKWISGFLLLSLWILSLPASMFLAALLTELGWKSSAIGIMWGWFGIMLLLHSSQASKSNPNTPERNDK